MDDEEREFWKDFIKKYLYPLEKDVVEEERIKVELIELRNKMTGAYFLINSLWIVLTFALSLSIQDINITFYVNGNATMVSHNFITKGTTSITLEIVEQGWQNVAFHVSIFLHLSSDTSCISCTRIQFV